MGMAAGFLPISINLRGGRIGRTRVRHEPFALPYWVYGRSVDRGRMYRIEIMNHGNSKFTAKTKNYEFNIDTSGEGCTPPDALLASLGSCIGVYIRKYAEGSKITLPEFTVTAEGDLSKESPVSFKLINVSVDLKGANIDDRRKQTLLSFIENCPIHNTLKHAPEIKIRLR